MEWFIAGETNLTDEVVREAMTEEDLAEEAEKVHLPDLNERNFS